jgi:hypothetical protein
VISSTTSTALYGRPRQSTHSYPLLTCLLLGSGVLLRLYRGQRGAFPMPSGKSQATFLSEGGVGVGATSFKNREKAALEPQLPETRPQRPIYRPGRIPLDARAVWCCFWGPMSPKAPSSGLKPAF